MSKTVLKTYFDNVKWTNANIIQKPDSKNLYQNVVKEDNNVEINGTAKQININTSSYGRKRKRKIIDGEVVCYPSKNRREKYDRDGNGKMRYLSFDWNEYLRSIEALSIPEDLFESLGCFSKISNIRGFQVNHKLEGVDPQNESLFCVLSVVEVNGARMRLHFDGYSDQFDFWVLQSSELIYPVGWCEATQHVLQPPKDYADKTFQWTEYLALTKSEGAPPYCFTINQTDYKKQSQVVSSLYPMGSKLEAVDKRNQCMVCVATVIDVIGQLVHIHFDSWEPAYDMWVHYQSPLLQPVGFCEEMECVLSVPSNYGHDLSSFNWDSYLEVTCSSPVPKSTFSERKAWWSHLEEGMRCELVDRRCPQLVRSAHIHAIDNEFQLTLSYDDWSDKYNVKCDLSLSRPCIFPVGWCSSNGCTLHPPPTYDSAIESSPCSIYGCKGLGHVKGSRYSNHQRISGCPYADCNINKDLATIKPDRVNSARPSSISLENRVVNISLASSHQGTATSNGDHDSRMLTILIPHQTTTNTITAAQSTTDTTAVTAQVIEYLPPEPQLPLPLPPDESPMDLSIKKLAPSIINGTVVSSILVDHTNTSHDASSIYDGVLHTSPPTDTHCQSPAVHPIDDADQEVQPSSHEETAEDAAILAHPPGDSPLPVQCSPKYPPSLALPATQLQGSKVFIQYESPPDLLPNPLAVIPSSVLRPRLGPAVPYHPSDEYRRLMELNITAQILTAPLASTTPGPHDISSWDSMQVAKFVAAVINTSQYSKLLIDQEVDGPALLHLKQLDLIKVLRMRLGHAIKLSTYIHYIKSRDIYPVKTAHINTVTSPGSS